MATKEDIWAAATTLAEAGERPTLSAVRRAVGGGSYTTISEAMTEWRARQTQPAPSREPAPESVVSQASDLAAAIWAQASALAQERLQVERTALDGARIEMEQERAEAVELADTLAAELDQIRAEMEAAVVESAEMGMVIERQAQEIERLRQEAVEARETAAKAQGQVEALERQLSEWRSRMVPIIGTVGG